jgi:adenosylmethionine-8-amino-7-oxononanoate aminotransferase
VSYMATWPGLGLACWRLTLAGRSFVHGHTYQGHPAGCAAALEVQRIIQEEKLVDNVREKGALLSKLLKERVGEHPNVADIRGRGFFWGIEFAEKDKTPFPTEAQVAMELSELGVANGDYSIAVYPCTGAADGVRGDLIIVSPPYNASSEQIETIVERVGRLIDDYFASKTVAP